MKKNILNSLGLISLLSFLAVGCFGGSSSNPKTSSQTRLNLPNWGIVIDATYDRQLDGVVPGYKILTVVLTNRSVDMIRLDQTSDQWFVEDAWGKKQKAINSLRIRDPQIWSQLPPKVKDLIDYPAGVQMGYTQTFDLFYPDSIDLQSFRSISFYSAALKQNFDALSSTSMDRAVPAAQDPNSEPIDKYLPKKTSTGTSKKAKGSAKYN